MYDGDRRVVRTRRLLKEALLDLIGEKGYEEITIRDITDRADIGYATFFRHYEGKDDLMLEIFSEIVEELESLPDKHAENYFEQEGYLLFQHVKDNLALYRGILDSHKFTKQLRERMSEMVQYHLSHHNDQGYNHIIPLEIAANHMLSSILGLIEWWISHGMPYPIERMAVIYDRLVIAATWHSLNPDNQR